MEAQPIDVKAIRVSLKETQAQFAKRFGVDQATVHRWEANGVPHRGATRFAIERVIEDLKQEAS